MRRRVFAYRCLILLAACLPSPVLSQSAANAGLGSAAGGDSRPWMLMLAALVD